MKKFYRSSVMTTLLFVMAAVLLFAGSVGGTQAALQYFSADYQTEIRLKNIGVTLLENTKAPGTTPVAVSYRDYSKTDANGMWSEHTGRLVQNMLEDAGDKAVKIGKEYNFELCAANSGQINQYVRVSLYKYWADEKGNKLVQYDPALIRIEPATNGKWTIQDETAERTVFYYNDILPFGDAPVITEPFTSKLSIDPQILDYVTVTTTTDAQGNTVTTYEYAYDGLQFIVDAQVDAVQSKNGERSVPSAWGRVRP